VINISCSEYNDLIVKSSYLPELVFISKKWHGVFNKENKTWQIPKANAKLFLSELSKSFYFDVDLSVMSFISDKYIINKRYYPIRKDIEVPEINGTVWAHQKEAFRFVAERGSAIVAIPPGTGKTMIPILLAKKNEDMLYLCPANAKTQIQREFKKFGNIGAEVVSPNKNRDYSHKGVIISSYELFARDFDKLPEKFSLIVAEAHKIKAPPKKGKKFLPFSTAVVKYAEEKVKYVVCLTGTPIISSAVDTVNMMKVIGKLDEKNYYAWKNKYTIRDHWRNIIAYKPNVVSYIKRLFENTYYRSKTELIDLPDIQISHVVIHPTEEEKEYYRIITTSIKKDIDINIKNRLSFNLKNYYVRAKQAAINSSVIAEMPRTKSFSKLAWVNNFLYEYNEKHLIIYCFFTTILDLIQKKLTNNIGPLKNIYRIDGHTKNVQEVKDKWEETGGILLASNSIAFELNMQFCSSLIFMNLPDTWLYFDQIRSRIYRAGQKKKVSLYILYMEDTIDERIWQLISNKNMRSKSILDNLTAKMLKEML